MGFSAAVDVAIGVILMYLALSLICTTVNELIATVLKLRARSLKKTMEVLIDNETLFQNFYKHGLIASEVTSSRAGSSPAGTQAAGGDHPSYFDGRTVAMALLGSLDPANKDPLNIAGIKAAIGTSPLADSKIGSVLLSIVTMAGDDVNKVRDDIATWFDSAMDRLSGAYKRRLKWISLGVGIVLAFALNADTLSVGQVLWKDQTLRSQLVDAADELLHADPASTKCGQGEEDLPAEIDCRLKVLEQQEQSLRPLPLGWSELPSDPVVLFLKVLGLLWTGLALSLGAPFWFDVLQKFMNVRGAGEKPEKEEKKAG